MKRLTNLCLLALVAPAFAGCASTDPLTIQNMERLQTIWEEDRRADLDPAKMAAREFEFQEALNYERSK